LFVSHVVYGLRVAANLALPGLPARPDLEGCDVLIHLKDWASFPTIFPESTEILYTSLKDAASDQPNLRVGLLPGGSYFAFFYRDGVKFAVERHGSEIWGDWPENYTLEDACTYLIGPVIGFVLRLRGMTCLHASAVAIGERAIALMGFPGAGKSTTAAAFAQRGFRVLADDVVALSQEGEGFLVSPGYPRVNLWPDSVRALLGSEEALPRITPTWEKRYLALGEKSLGFTSKPMPLGAIYLLDEREPRSATPAFEKIAGADAVALLAVNTYVNYLLDRDMRSREFDVLSRLVTEIPIRRVRPTADPCAIFDLCGAIARDAERVMVSNPPQPSSPLSQSHG
jgi:hypothetical protein